jgi:hypothetical protein
LRIGLLEPSGTRGKPEPQGVEGHLEKGPARLLLVVAQRVRINLACRLKKFSLGIAICGTRHGDYTGGGGGGADF